jgi:hypothetical protein
MNNVKLDSDFGLDRGTLQLWICTLVGMGYIKKDSQSYVNNEKAEKSCAVQREQDVDQHLKKMLEGFANARPHAVQLGNVLCEVFNRPGNVALAHAVAAINVAADLTVIG